MPPSGVFLRSIVMVTAAIALACCSTISRNVVPEGADLPPVLGVSGSVRFWGDTLPRNLEAIAPQREAQQRAAGGGLTDTVNYLALSGGGSDGAFGAGLLMGWSETGTRPTFDLVTGISTGALIAPFAFVGPAYDEQLKQMFTSYGQKDIAPLRPLLSISAEASIVDNTRMAALIDHYVTTDFVKAVAEEHRKGRRLLIGTTHLDAQRPVIWNMGEIATRGDSNAIALFRRIMLASTAIPGVFPPTLIKVERDGKAFDEMHVDGGVASQVFIFPAPLARRSLDKRLARAPKRRFYIIWNGRLNPEWEPVEPRLLKIAGRSISSLIKYEGRGDIDRIYFQSRAYTADFNLASIPPAFTLKEKEPFDVEYTNALFDLGYQLGRSGDHWQKKPPNL